MNYRRLSFVTITTYSSIQLYSHKNSNNLFTSAAASSPEPLSSYKSKSFLKHSLPVYAATYNANNPTEDRMISNQFVKDIQCLAIFDGHGGWQVSDFASQTIFHYLEQNILESNSNVSLDNVSNTEEVISINNKVFEENNIKNILIKTFQDVESSYIIKAREAYQLGFGEVAKVGCCALLALKYQDTLITANTGDCRAVLGTYRQDIDNNILPSSSSSMMLKQYKLNAIRLTNDHNAREEIEQKKLKFEHPNEDDVVRCHNSHACYVKGRLQLTRSLGDVYLKYREFNAPPLSHRSRGRHIPDPYTPPYVSHVPEVRVTKLSTTSSTTSSSSTDSNTNSNNGATIVTTTGSSSGEDKFLILATDGVWDFLSDQDAVDIVQQYCLDNHHHNENQADNHSNDSISSSSSSIQSIKRQSQAAELLVLKALEVAAREAGMSVEQLKELPPGSQRRKRHDDTTAIVMFF